MPLPTPILDDRSYQQLRDELVRRIPVYAPEWTDHNASDPGIALIELFSFLGENLLFRFNQIPESTKLEFLRLLEIPLRPAAAASGFVSFTTDDPGGDRIDLGSTVKAGNLPFETKTEVHVWPLSLQAIGRAASDPPQLPEELDFAARAIDARGGLAQNERPVYYRNKTVPLDPAAPGAVAVDFREAVDGMLWLAVLAGKGASLTELGNGILNIGFVPDEVVLAMTDVGACPGVGAGAPSPSVVWQFSTGELDASGAPRYRSAELVGDTTGGLTRPGVVRLQLPRDPTELGVFPVADPDLAGTGELPPELEDEQVAATVLFWLRAFRQDGGPVGRVLWMGANAAEVDQTAKAAPEFLGTGTGEADQSVSLVNRPVIDGSLRLEVEEPSGWTPWVAVDGFQASGEGDHHYVLDLEAATIRFGNGIQGRAPQIGERIRATEYRYGGGRAGNAAAKAISKIDGFPTVKVSNPLPASGGSDGETIAEALDRVPGELRRRDRAVTSGDFKELALQTPGAAVGRAECLPLFYPRKPDAQAAGVVSVAIWPREDLKRPNAPTPDRTLLRAVCAWLDARRLVTTELYVIPPTYHKVAVAVGVHVKPGFGVEAVRRWVELVIRQYLAPLPPYGPAGEGWPLGRRVHGPELEAAALQVEGVEYLEGLSVAGLSEDGTTWVPGSVALRPYEVPELAEITVVEGPPLTPGEALGPPAPEQPTVPIPIPVPKEEC